MLRALALPTEDGCTATSRSWLHAVRSRGAATWGAQTRTLAAGTAGLDEGPCMPYVPYIIQVHHGCVGPT